MNITLIGILNEMGGISYEARQWANHIHDRIKDMRKGEVVINGRDDIELYEVFSVDYFIIEINEELLAGGMYDESRSGFDADVYCVYLIFPPKPELYALNHELRHAYEDYKRRIKDKPGLSKTKESYNLFSGDFTALMTGDIKGNYGFFPKVIQALYYTSKIEESAYGESMVDKKDYIYDRIKNIVKIDYTDFRYYDQRVLERSWNNFRTDVNIPIIKKFKDYKSFLIWADKTIKHRGGKVLKKLLKLKYLRNK